MSTHIRSSGSRRARSIPVLALRQIPLALALAASGAVHAQGAQDGVTHQLDSVVVTASGFEQQIKEAPASISVITRENSKPSPFTTWPTRWPMSRRDGRGAAARPAA